MAPRKPAEQAEPTDRVFQLRSPAEGDANPVTRVSFGSSPHVSIGAGEHYATSDPALAARLVADELFEEVEA